MSETLTKPRRESLATQGECLACENKLGKVAMRNHLLGKCPDEPPGTKERILIAVSAGPRYWLYVDAAPSATLADIDAILRDTWLECCGHLSSFAIAGRDYESHPEGGRGMDVALGKVLAPGLEFRHEYDYGSTTELSLRVSGIRKVKLSPADVNLVARNVAPVFDCACGAPATQICAECMWQGAGDYCDRCIGGKGHKCGDEYALPLANSPRAGVCGYTGD